MLGPWWGAAKALWSVGFVERDAVGLDRWLLSLTHGSEIGTLCAFGTPQFGDPQPDVGVAFSHLDANGNSQYSANNLANENRRVVSLTMGALNRSGD